MKEVTGELNLTIIVIVAVAAVLAFIIPFLKNTVFPSIEDKWGNVDDPSYIYINYNFK